jgi:hypothetical protein
MRQLLEVTDFAHTLPLCIDEKGEIVCLTGDLALPKYREFLQSGVNFFALSMWQQFLADPGCRAKGGTRPTILHFPSPLRRDQLPADRLTELEEWSSNLQDPAWRDTFTLQVLDHVARNRTEESVRLHAEIEAHKQARADLRTAIQTQQERIDRLTAQIHVRERRIDALNRRIRELAHTLRAIRGSRSWRLLTALGRVKSRLLGRDR